MPWSANDYPSSMKGLSPAVRRHAIEIANAILQDGGDEGTAIATGISRAKEAGEKTGSAKHLLLQAAKGDDDSIMTDIAAPEVGTRPAAGALTAADESAAPDDPTLLIKGFGVMTKSQIESGIVTRSKDLLEQATLKRWNGVRYYISNGVIEAMCRALESFEETGLWYDTTTDTMKQWNAKRTP